MINNIKQIVVGFKEERKMAPLLTPSRSKRQESEKGDRKITDKNRKANIRPEIVRCPNRIICFRQAF